MPSHNGSAKGFAHQLTLAQHTKMATTLLLVRGEVLTLVDTLREGYGRADEKSRHAAKLLTAVDGLRSLLSQAALTEHCTEVPTPLTQCYYPRETSA